MIPERGKGAALKLRLLQTVDQIISGYGILLAGAEKCIAVLVSDVHHYFAVVGLNIQHVKQIFAVIDHAQRAECLIADDLPVDWYQKDQLVLR